MSRFIISLLFLDALCSVVVQADWASAVIWPWARCSLRLALLNFDGVSLEKFDEFYRNDSVQRIAEMGEFYGNDIREYAAAGGTDSPYFSSPISTSNEEVHFQGYDHDTAECTFLIKAVVSQKSRVPQEVEFKTASLGRIVLNLREGYVKQFDNFLPIGYWDVALRGVQESNEAREFVCSVMQNECSAILDDTENCIERLEKLPFTTSIPPAEEVLRFNEYSQSCRALHAVLALSEPEMHCPHLSFAPMKDPDGNIKCQEEGYGEKFAHLDLFTQEELKDFEDYVKNNGFDDTGTDFSLL